MKVIMLAMMLLLLGTGCASQEVWETVEDLMPSQPVSAWQERAYSIEVALPEHAELVGADARDSLYALDDGAFEVQTSVFLASDLNSAVKRLSGLRAEKLTVIQTTRFGLPEYQFAWYAQTEQGGRIYQADLVMDGIQCYAVVTAVPEDGGKGYNDLCRQVFSSFGLYFDEGV